MYLKTLSIKNIGPFSNFEIDFIDNPENPNNTVIITGENGAGKSVILDAIRSVLVGAFSDRLERNIISNEKDFLIRLNTIIDGKESDVTSYSLQNDGKSLQTNQHELNAHIFHELRVPPTWILDYWTSKLSTDKFEIENIPKLKHEEYLKKSLLGIHPNTDVTKLISSLDYLRGSEEPNEKALGEYLFNTCTQIINSCLNNAKFSHVSRISIEPIIRFGDHLISFNKLSSGNLFLIQRLLSLLQKAYSVYVLNGNIPIEDINKVKGLLLIDEVENHLHPKWQKAVLGIIKRFFPKIQIIVTTHSPFIVSSIEAKVFVCTYQDLHSTVSDETGTYLNKPVEEILRTPVFNTDSFNSRISKFLEIRKKALVDKEYEKAKRVERILLEINPDYFSYLQIDEMLKNIQTDEEN